MTEFNEFSDIEADYKEDKNFSHKSTNITFMHFQNAIGHSQQNNISSNQVDIPNTQNEGKRQLLDKKIYS